MADTSQQELTEPHTNGVMDGLTEEEKSKMRPADIEADVREMERRRRVEMMMNSKLFREELERIIETQMNNGSGPSGLLQQISDMMGAQGTRFNSNVFKNSNCVMPINDIRGVESMGYAKGEKLLRCKLAAVFRLLDLYGWTQGVGGQITARLNQDQQHYLVNPYGLLYHEITASSLVKVDMQGQVVEQGTTNFGVHIGGFQLHSTIHAARPDIKCIIHITTPSVTAVSSLKGGVLPIGEESIVIGEVSTHQWIGETVEPEEREKITRNLGPINKVMLLTNRGALCCGETIEEAFYNVYNTVLACETQLKLMPAGIENIALISEEAKKAIFEASRRQPVPHHSTITEPPALAEKLEKRWRIGSTEFEALMRMLDNAGFRTGYIYRHPLIKSEPPRPRNDVEVPPAVSSLGYLLEEEENYKQGLWKGGRKGFDRTHWLNSPNVYQKVEILETGTPDPKKITKWVSDGSPTHSSTPVRIDSALQFVPKNTNPKEFKVLQQQIKDNRRADKMTAGPQSHILEGVSWEEAKKMQDASMSATGESVVLVGAASKGIIQRGFQHNAMVYKTPYAKNPFDAITDQELDQYKKDVERKTKGDIYDESQSESEALSSFNISRATHESSTAKSPIQSPVSVTSETEEESRDEPRVLRIEKKQVPVPSQPEVVLSDGEKHGHDKVDDENRTVAAMVKKTTEIQQSVDFNNYPVVSKSKLEADATTQFLNEMRRNALEPRNDHNTRDYLSSIGDEVDMATGWSPRYQCCQMEVIKLNTVAELKKPKITEIKKNLSNNFVIKRHSNNSVFLAKRKFFEEYEKWYNEYRNSSRANFLRIVHETFGEKIKSLSPGNAQSDFPQNSKIFLNNEGFVKRIIIEKFSSNEHVNRDDSNFPTRKRAYTHIFTKISPGKCSKAKVPRLSLPSNIEMNDLRSPPLVSAIMKLSNNRKSKSEGNTPTSNYLINLEEHPCSKSSFSEMIDILTEELKISSSSEPTNSSSVVTITEQIYPKMEQVELINSDVNISTNEIDPLANLDEINHGDCIDKHELSDENGNSLKESSPKKITEDSVLNTVKIDWLDETDEELKLHFERDISDDCPWRYSSPIPKNYNREDSMTEVINSLNINLTPSKIKTSPFLPETDNSKKYNLNPSQLSMLYSLTPTASGDYDNEDNCKEHFNCGKINCPDCLFVGYPRDNALEHNSECSNESIELIWEEMIPSAKENAPITCGLRIDLNKTIDLFDNSIELETENDLSPDGSMDNEHCSVGGSDLLELPHSTFIELEESKDEVFLQDIATSANEVIAGLGEREALVHAENVIDDVLGDLACLNLETQEFSTDLRTVLEAKLTALHVAKHIIDEVMDEMGLEINPELTEEKQIKEIEEIIENSIGEDRKDGRESGSPLNVIVIDELIHHIIDKVSSSAENTSGSSPESFNLKKAKESANTEIKEFVESINEEGTLACQVPSVTPDLLKQVNDTEVVEDKTRLEYFKSSEDLINEIKLIFNGIDIDPESEGSMKEELEQIVASCCIDENGEVFSNDIEAFEHYANQMQLIAKAIVFEESLNKSKSDTLDSSDSAETSLYANKSESVKKFVSRFKKITKGKKTSSNGIVNTPDASESRISDVSTGHSFSSSLDVNLSLENTINISSQSENQVSSLENDTKSDNSREKVLMRDKNQSSDDLDKDYEDSLTTQTQNSDENITEDVEKNLVYMWDCKESEMEQSLNDIRGNDDSSAFIHYDQVDDNFSVVDEVNVNVLSLPNSPRNFKPDLPSISEDDELKIVNEAIAKERTLSPIIEDDISETKHTLEEIILDCNDDYNGAVMKKVPANSPELFQKCVTGISAEDDSGPSERSSMADFFSCKDESSTPFQTGQNSTENSAYTRLISQCGYENEETDSKCSATLYSDHETYTISECNSDDCQEETIYYGDVSSNLRRSDSFSTINSNPCDTTVNFADVSSALEELVISRKIDGKSEGMESFVIKCPICDNVPRLKSHPEKLSILECNYCNLKENQKEVNVDEGFIKKSRLNQRSSESREIPLKKCNICHKFPVFNGHFNEEDEGVILENSHIVMEDIKNTLNQNFNINGTYDVCAKCLMALSVDTREFIRIENIISSEEHSCELTNSPTPSVAAYENTTLCKIVSSMDLTPSFVDVYSLNEVDEDDPICAIRMLFELC